MSLTTELETSIVIDALLHLNENPLFWFLKNGRTHSLQHEFTDQTITPCGGGYPTTISSVVAETLAGNPANKLNEDSFLILPFGKERTLFAVLDGASSQKEITGLEPHGITGAFYVSHLVAFGFGGTPEHLELSQRESLTAGDVMKTINTWIHGKMQSIPGVNYEDVLTVPGMAATFLLVDAIANQLTLAHVADSVGGSIYEDGHTELLTPNQDERFDQETMDYLQKLAIAYQGNLALTLKNPDIKAKKKTQLQGSFRKKINQPDGCGILNGMPELEKNSLIYERTITKMAKLRSIVLLSDGALLPYTEKERQREDALTALIEQISRTNGKSMLQNGVSRLDNDPDFERIPRLKHRDDATIVAVSLFS